MIPALRLPRKRRVPARRGKSRRLLPVRCGLVVAGRAGREGRAFGGGGADGHLAAVGVEDLPDDVEAEADAAGAAERGAGGEGGLNVTRTGQRPIRR
jgi:hypothetical protein